MFLREGISVVEDVEGIKDKVDVEIVKLRVYDLEILGILLIWLIWIFCGLWWLRFMIIFVLLNVIMIIR